MLPHLDPSSPHILEAVFPLQPEEPLTTQESESKTLLEPIDLEEGNMLIRYICRGSVIGIFDPNYKPPLTEEHFAKEDSTPVQINHLA